MQVVETVQPAESSARAGEAASGGGTIELAHVAGATAVVRRRAHSPLKLLTPRAAGRCAHVVTSTYGGGLLAGDEIALRLVAGDDTRCALGTQASTKVYRGDADRPARQSLDASVGARAALAVVPDPVTCFAGAGYAQRQSFRLDPSASLLLIDWLTGGRAARGERWAFTRYRSDTRVSVGDAPVARDALLLDASDGVSVSDRMGRFDCLATLILLGPAFAAAAAGMLEGVGKMPVRRRAPLVASASPLKDGAVLRVAGGAAESVGRFITGLLEPAWPALGEDPWSRKW